MESDKMEQEERYRLMVECNPIGMYRTTPQGQIVYVNPALVDLMGYPDKQTLLQAEAQELYFEKNDRQPITRLFAALGVLQGIESRMRKYDGSEIWVRNSARVIKDEQDNILFYEGSLEDITPQRLAEDTLRRELELNEAREKASAALTATLDYEQVLDTILEQVANITPNTTAMIALIREDQFHKIRTRGFGKFTTVRVDFNENVHDIKTLSGRQEVIDTQEPYLIADTSVYADWINVPGFDWVKSHLILPILARGRVVGFLDVDSPQANYFSPQYIRALNTFSRHAATALENARLHAVIKQELIERRRIEAELRLEHDIAEALNKASTALTAVLDFEQVLDTILEQVTLVIPGAAALIALLKDGIMMNAHWRGHEKYSPVEFLSSMQIPLDKAPNLKEAAETQKPTLIPDTLKDSSWLGLPEVSWIRSHIATPITIHGEVIGFLNMDSPQPNFFTSEHGEVLMAFSLHAAVAIENSRLFGAAQQELAERRLAEEALQKAHDNLEARVNDRTQELELANAALKNEIVIRQETEEKLHLLATTDPLTNLFNRRWFFELAQAAQERSKRYGHPLSVAMLDIDHFKNVNDTFGHQAGDLVLQKLARICEEVVRETDLLGRYGGEEFIVLLPETGEDASMLAAERLRQEIEETPFIIDDKTIQMTVSLGVTTMMGGETLSIGTLFDRADQALYTSKKAGRNRVTLWKSDLQEKQ
jgi:diguanylate cyclase (GGDEF)-like protein/PAS domain S-box-containing protein